MSSRNWDVVIGLEIHVQLNTKSKIFSGSSTTFGASPNTQASLIDLGFPGVLPTINAEVFRKAIAFGLSIGATINLRSEFDRKNYFYPDLPKGYQITQLALPIVVGGKIKITDDKGDPKQIRVTRAHLEEDAGKSLHENYAGLSGIDLNRAGTPLLEIVSEPEMSSALEAVAYARQVHRLVTYLDVSDGEMSEGSFRCDANVSLRQPGAKELGTRTETKNVNSFRFLERAINFEIERQAGILDDGGVVTQETRLYDADKDETRPMRSKETSMDYRYFPEPDLLPIVLDHEFINKVKLSMPELPEARQARYVSEMGLKPEDAGVLVASLELASYFEDVLEAASDAMAASNWVRVEVMGKLNNDDIGIRECPVPAKELGTLIQRIKDGTISGKIAKQVFEALWQKQASSADQYIEQQGLAQVSGADSLTPIIERIIANNPNQAEQFKAGKTKLMGFFVGQVMKETGGKANPVEVNDIVSRMLAE